MFQWSVVSISRAQCTSGGISVVCLRMMAILYDFVKRLMRNASLISWRTSNDVEQMLGDVNVSSCTISRTRRSKGRRAIRRFVPFCCFRISMSARVPGRKRCGRRCLTMQLLTFFAATNAAFAPCDTERFDATDFCFLVSTAVLRDGALIFIFAMSFRFRFVFFLGLCGLCDMQKWRKE